MQSTPSPVTIIGTTTKRYETEPRAFGILQPDRLHHMYIIGQTGAGKSTLLYNLMRQDLLHEVGFCLLDPHGDLAEEIAAHANDRAVIWNPADPLCDYGYNPLTRVTDEYRPLVVSGLITALKKQWADAWGARMEHLLRFALFALLEQPSASLEDIMPLFLNEQFRERAIEHVADPQVRHFWTVEFKKLRYQNSVDGISPIANKLSGFLAHPLLRKALCHPEKPIRLRQIMDEGQALIINLAKGKIGADSANLLGGLVITSLGHAAYSRQNMPQTLRRPFFIYADEFHSITTEAFSEMLSELRKYKVGLVLAHQHTEQISKPVLEAIIGNVGTWIVFRVGATDASLLSKQLGSVAPSDLIRLPNFQFFTRLLIEGRQSEVFTGTSLNHVMRQAWAGPFPQVVQDDDSSIASAS